MTKIAIVTGASRGLGRNTALALADKGHGVIITYLGNAEAAQDVVSQIEAKGQKAAAFQLDAGDISAFSGFAGKLETLLKSKFNRDSFDILVNNAGHAEYAPMAETTEAQFDGLVNVHFKGVFFLTQTLLPLIADSGRILNVSSGLTRVSFPGFGAYSCVKNAVEMMSVYFARELGNRGITVNTIAPGAIETDFGGGVVRDTPELNAQFAEMTALGRVGLPDDIGAMIANFVSDDNGWVTGQRIEVSGGQSI